MSASRRSPCESHAACLAIPGMSPAAWVPPHRDDAHVPAGLTPRPMNRPPVVQGTIVRADGPILEPIRWSPWRALSLLGLAILVGPWLLGLLLVGVAFSAALSLLFRRKSTGGRGWFAEILIFHVLGALFRPGRIGPVYHYVLQTGHTQHAVRQEGELATGRIFVGNQLHLNGSWHDGELVVRDGVNLTLGTQIRARGDGWRLAVPWIALALLFQYGYLLSLS